MKVKILIVPLAILVVVVLMIWFIYPALTNGTDGLKEKYSQLKTEENKLADINKKASNVKQLYAALTAASEKQDVVNKFIPEQVKEEEIIDNLNFLASTAGLSVLGISVSVPVQTASLDAVAATPASPTGEATLVPGAAAVEIPPKASLVSASFSVGGTYENIKSFLAKLNSFERYNKLVSWTIANQSNTNGAKISNFLQLNAEISFNYFKKDALKSDTNPVFLSGKLDTSVIDAIQASQNVDVLKLNIDQVGKANPFLP